MEDPDEIARFHDRCSDLMRELLDALAASPDRPRTFPEIALVPYDLTHVQFVLLASLWWLEDNYAPPTQAQLAQHAGTDAMMTSQVIRKLERRGLVDRHPDPVDSRARRLQLTITGAALLTSALADVEATDDAYFVTLEQGREAFLAALAALVSHNP
jgi:DNA-binding MarR family transcriptional regulator